MGNRPDATQVPEPYPPVGDTNRSFHRRVLTVGLPPVHTEDMNTTHPTAATIKPGDVLGWTVWTGETATTTVQIVSPYRISADRGMYWEATCFRSLDESLAATRDLHIIR